MSDHIAVQNSRSYGIIGLGESSEVMEADMFVSSDELFRIHQTTSLSFTRGGSDGTIVVNEV